MKKILIIFLLLTFTTVIAYAEADPLIEDYLEVIENDLFTQDDLDDYLLQSYDSPEYDALEYFLIARVQLNHYDYKLAYENLIAALDATREHQQVRLSTEILYYLSTLEFYFYDVPNALDHSYELLTLSEEVGYHKGVIEAYFNIAFGYIYYYDFDEGLKFANEALAYSNTYNYDLTKAKYYRFLGDVEFYKTNIAEAEDHLERALEELPATISSFVIEHPARSYKRALTQIHLENNKYDLAYRELNEQLESIPDEDTYSLYLIQQLLGRYHYNVNPNESLKFYEKALDNYQKSSIIETAYPRQLNLFESLGALNYSLGNYQVAADYLYEVFQVSTEQEYDIEETLSELEDIKYSEMNDQLSLLEQLNISEKEKVTLSNNLLKVTIVSILILLIAGIFIVIEMRLKAKTEKELYKLSTTDSLTGIYNRGKIIEIFENNLNKNSAILLLDLDDFKNVNDTFGHVTGDNVLIQIAQIIKSSIRTTDSVGRYGGEEFLVFLDNTTSEDCLEISERIRFSIETFDWSTADLKVALKSELITTASIGITTCFSDDVEEVLHEVDTLMYQAKNSGKNKVIFREVYN